MKARILVVDDEAEIRRSVRMILEYEGYDVQEASSGPEAIALIEREPPDLAFLDIKMGVLGLRNWTWTRWLDSDAHRYAFTHKPCIATSMPIDAWDCSNTFATRTQHQPE